MNLESTRGGKIFCAVGATFLALAAGLTVWDLAAGPWWVALLNIITAGNGVWMLCLGCREIRRAREHHEYMEAHRRRLAGMLDGGDQS